ncbi:TetR/AcrR family transcriptional regulator [Streptomyces sp. NPDC058812]|uniref:TetR/AcrR family transcriptional regulator n=1 Tax=unclassified Streptomyces TaxID=2593676 RepID=UPI0036BBBA85
MKKVSSSADRPASVSESLPATRERIVRAASRLMQRQGYDGTGIKQISLEASATLGSVYHFFPGGKQELAVAAVRRGDQEFLDELRAALDAHPEPAQAVRACAVRIADGLRASDWLDGCPITTTALGTAGRFPDIQAAAAEAFAHWHALLFERLCAAGIEETDARDLAYTVINTLEGAELVAQMQQDGEPLKVAGRHLARLIEGFVPATSQKRTRSDRV